MSRRRPPARVVVVAGPSGSGKSRVARRVGWPVLRLDDFYREGGEPGLPMLDAGLVDWDDPRSWDRDAACDAIERLCRDGHVDAPVYEIAANARVGHREVDLAGSPMFVAEGIFAPYVVASCRERGLLADAICVRHHRVVTFVLRLVRDLRERRKTPLVLLRRGWGLLHAEPRIVRDAESMGCRAMTPRRAEQRLRKLADARTG
ncbi:MAG: uridine kinase family protein [Nocardioidaceae bacterium]